MEIVWILVPAALVMGLGFLALYIVAAKSGQFEDLETPAFRMLFDEKEIQDMKNGGKRK